MAIIIATITIISFIRLDVYKRQLLEGVTEDENNVDYTQLYYSKAGENDWKLITQIENSEKNSLFNWSYSWKPEEEGVYDIYASGTDLARNIEKSAIIYSLTYDITPPIIESVILKRGKLEDIKTDCGLSELDKIEIKIGDGDNWELYTPGMNLNKMVDIKPGTYTVSIKVLDKARNEKIKKELFTVPGPLSALSEEILEVVTTPTIPGEVWKLYLYWYIPQYIHI